MVYYSINVRDDVLQCFADAWHLDYHVKFPSLNALITSLISSAAPNIKSRPEAVADLTSQEANPTTN